MGSKKSIIRDCVALLRQEILLFQSTPLGSNITANDIMNGEMTLPEDR